MPIPEPTNRWPRLKNKTSKYASKMILRGVQTETVDQVYKSLTTPTSIRLLELLPGHDADPVRCHLQITDTKNTPEYEALSYVWGDPKDKHKVECDEGRVEIPTSLHDLLQQLRDPIRSRTLWADAICINQADLKEVGHQVRQMAAIYSSAKRVLIWLGPKDPFHSWDKDEQPATIIQQCLNLSNNNDPMQTFSLTDIQMFAKFDLNLAVSAVSELFERPWFERVWVLQEAGLARSGHVLFGHRAIEYDALMDFTLQMIDEHFELVYGSAIPSQTRILTLFLKDHWSSDSWTADQVDFLDLLDLSRIQLATDPRDYIYALLGHPSAKSNDALFIEPDYRKNSPEIFHEAAMKLIQYNQNLRVLSAVLHIDQELFNRKYPSWVPTWTRDYRNNSFGVIRSKSLDWDADTGKSMKLSFANKNKILQVEGFVFDTIDECTDIIEPSGGPFMEAWWPIADAMRFKRKQKMSTPEFLSELTMTLVDKTRSSNAKAQDLANFAAFRLYFSRDESYVDYVNKNSAHMDSDLRYLSPNDLFPEGYVAAEMASFGGDQLKFRQYCLTLGFGRRLFITKSGSFGLGPMSLRPGDVCCILYGGCVPFILRPVGSRRHRLVGEAYVRRVMVGEAVADLILGEKYQEQVFNIF